MKSWWPLIIVNGMLVSVFAYFLAEFIRNGTFMGGWLSLVYYLGDFSLLFLIIHGNVMMWRKYRRQLFRDLASARRRTAEDVYSYPRPLFKRVEER